MSWETCPFFPGRKHRERKFHAEIAKNTEERILIIPYEALKQFVHSYQVQTVPAGTIEITAKQLFEAFKANQLQADMMYMNKTLKITGNVAGIKKDWEDNYYVALEGSSSFSTVDVFVITSELSKIANLKIGQNVISIGSCEGYSGISIEIKNATIQIIN